MNDSSNDFIRKIIGEFDKLSYISPEDVPDIALYMDQITTFMDSRLDACKRHPDDKILTKTMQMLLFTSRSKEITDHDVMTGLDGYRLNKIHSDDSEHRIAVFLFLRFYRLG